MVRKKNRYVVAEIVYDDNNNVHPLTEHTLYQGIRETYHSCFGDYGIALVKASLSVKFITEETRIMVVRIRRGAESMLINALTMMKSLEKEPMKIVTLQTTGTIRCAQKFWIRHSRKKLHEQINAVTSPIEKKELLLKIAKIGEVDMSEIFKRFTNTRPKEGLNMKTENRRSLMKR